MAYEAKSGMRTSLDEAIKGLEQGDYTPESRASQAGQKEESKRRKKKGLKPYKEGEVVTGVKGGDMGDSALVKGYKKSVFKSAAAIHKILMDEENTDSSHHSGSDY